MSFTDPIADMITRFRNAQMRGLNTVKIPNSKFRAKILDVLKGEGFISYYELLFHLGKLNAKDLNLNVILFDDEKNYNSVKGKWLEIID